MAITIVDPRVIYIYLKPAAESALRIRMTTPQAVKPSDLRQKNQATRLLRGVVESGRHSCYVPDHRYL